MNRINGLAPFRGSKGMTLISPIAKSTYNSDTSTWSKDTDLSESLGAYATTWLINRGKYSGRVFFNFNGNIVLWYDIATKTVKESETFYLGKRFSVNLALKTGGSLSTDVVSDRYRMYYEDVEDDYVIVRWEINYHTGSKYVNYYVEATVYKDGTFLINTSEDKPSTSLTVSYSYDVGSGTSTLNGTSSSVSFSGRRSFVILPPESSDFGWGGELSSTNYSLSDLRYPVTYSVVQNRINRNSSPNKLILPRMYHLCTNSDKAPSGNLRKVYIGNVKGNKYFLYGSDAKSYDTDNLKFHIDGKTYNVYNGDEKAKVVIDGAKSGTRDPVSRCYTSSSSYYWIDWFSYGFVDGITVSKAIISYNMDTSSGSDDFGKEIPQGRYDDLYLLYKTTSAGSQSSIGRNQSGWNYMSATLTAFGADSSNYGASGSVVFEFSSPTTIYELAYGGVSLGSGYWSWNFVDNIVLL